MKTPQKRILLILGFIVWLAATTSGLAILLKYQNTPGATEISRAEWPAGSSLDLNPSKLTLILFAHPHCPCTRATIGELALLMTQSQGRIRATVLFHVPADSTKDWARTDLWRSAEAIPGVSVGEDKDGVEAARFHASTSGHTSVFEPNGKLAFSGGITEGRGHAGDNAGRSAIISLARGEEVARPHTPVFGCALSEREARESRWNR